MKIFFLFERGGDKGKETMKKDHLSKDRDFL
jgi:hypothetical protein